MKSFFSIPVIIAFLACSAGCKKATHSPHCTLDRSGLQSADTVYPSDYLVAYPGSWWNYSNGITESASNWEEVIVNLKESEGVCSLYKVILPTTSNGLVYDSKYCTIPSLFEYSRFEPVLDTVVGEFYEEVINGSGSRTTITKRCEGTIPSLVVSGNTYQDVLHIKKQESTHYHHTGGGPTFSYDFYYASGVGLIRKISNTSSYDTVDLVNYYIAPH